MAFSSFHFFTRFLHTSYTLSAHYLLVSCTLFICLFGKLYLNLNQHVGHIMNIVNSIKTYESVKLLTLCCLIGISLNLSAHAQDRGSKDKPEHKRPQFSSLDLDQDGSVTFEEFAKSEVPSDDYATIFGHIDANGDGILTEQEFSNHKPPRRYR
jgi:Ca2+-binding EF-hand superfamily protein